MLQWEHLSQATDRQLNNTQANGDKGNIETPAQTGTSYTDTFDLSSLVSVCVARERYFTTHVFFCLIKISVLFQLLILFQNTSSQRCF